MKAQHVIAVFVTFASVGAACSDSGRNADAEPDPVPTAADRVDVTAGDETDDAETDRTPASTPAPTAPGSETLVFDLDAPKPASIDLSLQTETATAATIGPSGGSLTTTATDGTVFTLTVPLGALVSATEITMTPIESATGDAIGDHFLAGVELGPSGLHLLGTAELDITTSSDDAVAWGSSGGQDYHLSPSEHAEGTTTIAVLHFSEFGLARRQARDLYLSQGFLPEDLDAQLTTLMEVAPDEIAMELAVSIADVLTVELEPGDPDEDYVLFEQLGSDVVTHVVRMLAGTIYRGWGPATPGFEEYSAAFYGLVDSWFVNADQIVGQQAGLCEDGHLEAAFRTLRQGLVGVYMLALLSAFDDQGDQDEYVEGVVESYLSSWAEAGVDCLWLGVTWQARIVTTGQGFRSDINIGAEAEPPRPETFDALDWLVSRRERPDELPSLPIETELEVEWVEGFFADPILGCEPTSGRVELGYEDLVVVMPNLGDIGDVVIGESPFFVRVRLIEPIQLVCRPGLGFSADAAYPFHLGALEHLNGILDVSGSWYFRMDYEPGGGEVARFEQGFPVDGEGVIVDGAQLDFGDGKYELWQLVTVYQG